MMKLMMKLAHWSGFHRFFLSYGPQNVENGQFILGFMLSSAKLEVIWCNLIKINQVNLQNRSSESHTRFFIYKENFFKKMSLKNPKALRKC